MMAGMRVHFAPPPEDLAPYVHCFWGWQASGAEPMALPLLLPGTGAELHLHHGSPFRLDDGTALPPAYLLCLRQARLPLAAARDVGFVAVRLRIGQVHRLLAPPPSALLDQVLPLDEGWGRAGRTLAARVRDAAGWDARLTLLIDFLRRQIGVGTEDALVAEGMARLYRERGRQTIDGLASGLGMGRRQLEKRWRRYCGQTPAETRGAIRFQHTMKQILLRPDEAPLALALDHGYYDQAHWIHDFRRRLGQAPARQLAALRGRPHFYNPAGP